MAAIIFPTPAQALLQTPLNTFSSTSTPLANTSNSFTYVYNTTLGVWEGSAGGGGGGTYTATAPIVVTGTVISVNLGLGVAANGTNLALKVPVAATPPAINTTATGGFDGSMYWDDTLGQLFIRYNNTGSPTWVAAAPPAGSGGSFLPLSGGTLTGGLNGTTASFTGNMSFNSGYGSAAVAYGCRAWVNFNGVPASPTIRGSGNVSSVTKLATGEYTINMTTAMPDTNFAFSAFPGGTVNAYLIRDVSDAYPRTTTSFSIKCVETTFNPINPGIVNISVIR